MELSKIPTLVVGLIVAILIVTVVAVPIIDDASKTIVTEMNNPTGIYSMAASSSGDEVTIEPGTNGSLIINGVEQNQPNQSGIEKIWGQDLAIRITTDNSNKTQFQPTVTGIGTITSIRYASGVISLTGSTGNTTIDSPFFLYPDVNGTYGEYDTRNSIMGEIFINKTSKAWIGSAGLNYMLYDISGGNASVVGTQIMNSVTVNTTITAQFLESDDGLSYQVAKNPTINYTNPETSETVNNNWLMLYCPISYLSISETDGAIRTIIDIMPLVLIVSMLIAVVGTIFVKYN